MKKLKLRTETIKLLSATQLRGAAGGATGTLSGCGPTEGYTVCLCTTHYPASCPCVDTAQCEPSYRICG